MGSDHVNKKATAYYSVTKNPPQTMHGFMGSVSCCTALLKRKGKGSLIIRQVFKKWCHNGCNTSVT